jgi:hypothetical protein
MIDNDGFRKFLNVIGANLNTLRTIKNQSIDMVAAMTGIDSDILDQIEKGQYNWEAGMIQTLCEHYNIKVRDLAKENNNWHEILFNS